VTRSARLLCSTAVLALGAAVSLLGPAAAAASTLSLRLEGRPLEDRPFNVIAEGLAQNDRSWSTSNLTARIKELRPGAACGPDFQADAGSIVTLSYAVESGPYRVPLPITVDEPGRMLLCVWFDSVSADPHRSASLVIDVRAPRHRLGVAAPGRVARGRAAVVRLSGNAELPRLLLTRLVRGRASCGQAAASVNEWPPLTSVRPVEGAFRLDVNTRGFRRPGTYTVCAYLQEDPAEPRAELLARRVVRVR
jgi:hypothetical protein